LTLRQIGIALGSETYNLKHNKMNTKIVAKRTFTGLNNIAETALFVVDEDGLYRISGYASTPEPLNNGINMRIKYTDRERLNDFSDNDNTIFSISDNQNYSHFDGRVFFAVKDSTISIDLVEDEGPTSSPTPSIDIVLEKL